MRSLFKIVLLILWLSMNHIYADHTFQICNMSQDLTLNGYIDWWGTNNNQSNFSLTPGQSIAISNGDKCLKGFYYATGQPCSYEDDDPCLYAGGGFLGDDLASCESSTYIFGSSDLNEAWGSIDGIMDGVSAVNEILACQANNNYEIAASCYCPAFGEGCSTEFGQVACFLACWLGGQNQGDSGGGGGDGDDAVASMHTHNQAHSWQEIDLKNVTSKKKPRIMVRKRHAITKLDSIKTPIADLSHGVDINSAALVDQEIKNSLVNLDAADVAEKYTSNKKIIKR